MIDILEGDVYSILSCLEKNADKMNIPCDLNPLKILNCIFS